MRTTRTRQLLVLVAGFFAMALLAAAPAAADVDCADLRTKAAAQAYFEGRAGDADRLDADADGHACEGNNPTTPGGWSLIGLGVLVVAALVTNQVVGRRPGAERPPRAEPVLQPASVPAGQRIHGAVVPVGQKQRLVSAAPTGSLDDLERALRLIPHGERMPLLEEHAQAHGSTPQDVLDALVHESGDLRLQGWALAGYDPPSSVRLMACPCVDGMRNFKLHTSADGVRSWTCATCESPRRQVSDGDGGSSAHRS